MYQHYVTHRLFVQVLHFAVYIPLHHHLEIVETIKKFLAVKSVPWMQAIATDLLRAALPSFIRCVPRLALKFLFSDCHSLFGCNRFSDQQDMEETVAFLQDVNIDF